MISKKISELINKQITNEQFAAQSYLSMSAWFAIRDLNGIANYFRVQSKEELMHADKMVDYLLNVGEEVVLGAIPQPENNFNSEIEIFEKALAQEKGVTKDIFNIMKVANEEADFATISFFQWFVNEQVEEESSASQLIAKMKMVNDNPSALFLFDQELSQRTFTATAAE